MTAPTVLTEARSRPGVPALSGTTVVGAATAMLATISILAVDGFATTSNIRGLLLSVSLIGIVAVGLSLITIVGKVFTLSIPPLVALATILFAHSLHLGQWVALLLAVLLGVGVGLAQGLVIGRLETDPIITTIAAAAIMLGIGQIWTDGRTIVGQGDPTTFNSNIFDAIPFQGAVFILLTAALYWWHHYSVLGRQLTLSGLNERAARVSGLRPWQLVTIAFVISGATTGLAGALLAAQSGQGTLLLGRDMGFDAIVAVVVGGIGIKGGVGTPIGAAVGAVFVGLLENILALAQYEYQTQLVVKGALVLVAVIAMGVAINRAGGRR